MDEQPVQLLGNRYKTMPMKPGSPEKEDYQYTRNGTCAIFMFTAPLEGWHHVDAQEHRTKIDWARQIDYLVNVVFPDKQKIRLVQDNLNTHTLGALYEAFEPEKARAIAKRLEIHYTPKHGSWLNIAEIELSALTKQCLCRRISELNVLRKEIAAWELILSYPEFFSAAAPICGGGMSWRAADIISLPIRVFHGDADDVVPPYLSYDMTDAVNRRGGNAKLTVFYGCQHDSWILAYENTDVIMWLVKQVNL